MVSLVKQRTRVLSESMRDCAYLSVARVQETEAEGAVERKLYLATEHPDSATLITCAFDSPLMYLALLVCLPDFRVSRLTIASRIW